MPWRKVGARCVRGAVGGDAPGQKKTLFRRCTVAGNIGGDPPGNEIIASGRYLRRRKPEKKDKRERRDGSDDNSGKPRTSDPAAGIPDER